MPQHTPGPWRLADDIGTPANIDAADGTQVALAFQRRPGGMPHDTERLANASLIAAAPEMYEALKAVQEWLLDTDFIRNDNGFYRNDFVKANNLTLAAIAKAEGQS